MSRPLTKGGSTFHALCLVSGVALLLALGDWPYAYYQLLRWLVCATAISGVLYLKGPWRVVMACMAVLFNPITPIHLDRALWKGLEVVAAFIVLSCPAYYTEPGAPISNQLKEPR